MGKYMKKRERFWIPGFLMLFFVPYIGVMAVNGVEAAIINRTPQPEEYIPLILSLQIPDDYEKEAVKAQAVIARTNFFRKIQEKNISDVLGEISGEIKKEKTSISNKYAYKNVEVKEYSGMSNFTMELYLLVKKKTSEVSLEDIGSSLSFFKEYEDDYYYAVYNSETNVGGYNKK